jgi:RNA polymerase sigma factor (sigma-70 family)
VTDVHDCADQLAGGLIAVEDELAREFEALLAESSSLSFRVAYSVLRHRENAEDVAQEAFAQAYRRFRQLRDRQRFRAWLVRMTWRLALDRQRADRRRALRELEQPKGAVEPTTADAVAARQRAMHLWQAIDALPPKLRMVVVLSSIEGHDVVEVGRLLRIPEGTVKSRLFAARARLKEQLQWLKSDGRPR